MTQPGFGFHGALRCGVVAPSRVAWLVWLCLSAPLCRGAEEPSRTALADRLGELASRVARSPAANVTVVGSNRVENLTLLGWLADFARRSEQVTGLAFDASARELRVTVVDDPSGVPPVTVEQVGVGGRVEQRIRFAGYATAYVDEGRLALARAVLGVHLGGGRPGAALDAPAWLVGGFERNLSIDDRAAAMETVLTAWQAGQLGPIASLLDGRPTLVRAKAEDHAVLIRAWQGAFVYWLSMPQGRANRFRALFDRIARGAPVTADLVFGLLPDGAGADLDEAWDRWLLRHRRVVHHVGAVSERVLDVLHAELLLYPGSCAIPLNIDASPPLRLADAIRRRDEPWVPGFARVKIARLRMLGTGRAKALQDVVEAYCDILQGMLDGDDDETLHRRLGAAEAAGVLLRERVKQAGGLLEEGQP